MKNGHWKFNKETQVVGFRYLLVYCLSNDFWRQSIKKVQSVKSPTYFQQQSNLVVDGNLGTIHRSATQKYVVTSAHLKGNESFNKTKSNIGV